MIQAKSREYQSYAQGVCDAGDGPSVICLPLLVLKDPFHQAIHLTFMRIVLS